MAYLGTYGRVRRLPAPAYRPAPGLWAGRPVVGLAADPTPVASDVPWKTIAVLIAMPIVFAMTGDK